MKITVNAEITEVGTSPSDPRGPAWLSAETNVAGKHVKVEYTGLAIAEVGGKTVGQAIAVEVP